VTRRRQDHSQPPGQAEPTEVVRRYLAALQPRSGTPDPRVGWEQPTGDDRELPVLEEAFVEVAAHYSRAEHLSYAAWRAAGVSPPSWVAPVSAPVADRPQRRSPRGRRGQGRFFRRTTPG
jgi:hypothetical protein